MNRTILSIPSSFLKVTAAGLVLFLGLFLPGPVKAQFSTNCDNSNFNLGNFKGWTGSYGTFTVPDQFLGFVQTASGETPDHCRSRERSIQTPAAG